MTNAMVCYKHIGFDKRTIIFDSIVDQFVSALQKVPNVEDIRVYRVGRVPLEELPPETQIEVKEVLKDYDKCWVYHEGTVFHAMPCVGIKSNYWLDHFVCGCYCE